MIIKPIKPSPGASRETWDEYYRLKKKYDKLIAQLTDVKNVQ